jgi:hypothetical protein
MSIRDLSDNDLADVATRVAGLLAGTELSAIDSHVRAELITAFGTLPADLAAQTAAAADQDSGKIAAVSVKNSTRFAVLSLFGRVRDALKSGLAPKEQFDLCDLEYPGTPRAKQYIAQDPTKMTVVGFSNGINKGTFQGNNPSNRVTYEIWRREGDSGAWHQHALTKRQSFTDKGITPGQYYEYRVRAVAAQTESNFSNSAAVYGVL